MNPKFEYELNQQLENPSFTKISMQAMKIWREAEEGSEIHNMVKELIDIIDQEQRKMESIKSLMYLIAGKM